MENRRKEEILSILYSKGRVSVGELSRTLYVSEMTIRRDLAEMENGGKVNAKGRHLLLPCGFLAWRC